MGFRTFREIVAWQKGKELARIVYETSRSMPDSEKFGLTSQMRRASVSIPANIAEGFGRGTSPELAKACRMARGSLFELMTHVELSEELGMLVHSEPLWLLLEETDRVMQGLIRSIDH